jgi:hypothetical protein
MIKFLKQNYEGITMNKFLIAAILSFIATTANAKDVLYPQAACAQILSAEYSSGNGDTSIEQFEILCKSNEGVYTVFVTSWTTIAGFFGAGRYTHETKINLIPYNGTELKPR